MNGDDPNRMSLETVEISLGGRPLLHVNESVRPGEILTLMGPSGSGKSSLLAYIGGFLDPVFTASGKVLLSRENVIEKPASERRVGILFQDPLLFPHMSVGENLLFGLAAAVKGKASRRLAAEDALEEANLTGFFDRDPATLSGGQKARVALMRVLLAKPKALLLDEPFSKLDMDLRGRVRGFVFEEARLQKLPVVLVTHDQADADAASANGGGKVIRLTGEG